MSILIYRNNQQFGPYDDAQIVEMLRNGSVSPNDSAIRQGGTEWRPLHELVAVPAGVSATVSPASPTSGQTSEIKPKKSRAGLLLGCGGFFLILLLIGGVLGFFAYRNLSPADSPELRPATVGDFKLKSDYPPKGNIWGTETSYVALYEDTIGSNSVIYMVTKFSDASTAKEKFESDLSDSCKSDRPIRFNFLKDGKTVAVGGTCGGGVYVQRDDKVAVVGGSADASSIVDFADSMPLTAGTTREKK